MSKLALIFLASGLGGVLRYWLGGLVQGWWANTAPVSAGFPVGTLLVNVSGCLAIGMLATLFAGTVAARQDIQIGILVGLLGGYTTFSAFGRETFELIQNGRPASAGLYVLLTNVAGLAAVWLGIVLAGRFTATPAP